MKQQQRALIPKDWIICANQEVAPLITHKDPLLPYTFI